MPATADSVGLGLAYFEDRRPLLGICEGSDKLEDLANAARKARLRKRILEIFSFGGFTFHAFVAVMQVDLRLLFRGTPMFRGSCFKGVSVTTQTCSLEHLGFCSPCSSKATNPSWLQLFKRPAILDPSAEAAWASEGQALELILMTHLQGGWAGLRL